MTDLTEGSALVLGIVEGLTEFVPVSSTGHLILTSYLLGLKGEAVETFEIFIQLGAILAVLCLYFGRFAGLLNVSRGQWSELRFASRPSVASFEGLHGLARLAAAALPIFVLGALFGSTIKEFLFNSQTVAVALIVGGIAMWWVEGRSQPATVGRIEDLSLRTAFMVGVCQCFALWPGMSRSASTIVGGMLVGIERRVAAEFSFLVAVPVMCVATMVDLLKNLHVLGAEHVQTFAIGFGVSFVVALFAVKGFIALLGSMSLRPFAVYRVIVGIVVLVAF